MFDKIIEFTLKYEGGYVNDPDDPGGETKFGISKRSYPNVNIADLTKIDAIKIYERDYWKAVDFGPMDDKVKMALFDTAVNCGAGTARRFYTSTAAKLDYKDILLMRMEYYVQICTRNPKLIKFLSGWTNRVMALWKFLA